jgi:hypothetical protein
MSVTDWQDNVLCVGMFVRGSGLIENHKEFKPFSLPGQHGRLSSAFSALDCCSHKNENPHAAAAAASSAAPRQM